MRSKVLTVTKMKLVFWVVTPCGLVVGSIKVSEEHTACNFSPEGGGSMFVRNVDINLQVYTALQP
jgi:hypothetical protein